MPAVMRVGVIGGGQLGRMLALAGIPLGLSFRFLDPSPDAPAGEVGELLVGAYDDATLLDRLADGAAVVTYEFENVPVEAARRVRAIPAAQALEASQDRLVEKQLFRRLGIPTAPIDDEVTSFPALLKTRRLGYDGKGQRLVETRPGPPLDMSMGATFRATTSSKGSSRSTASCRCSPCAEPAARRRSIR